MNRRNFIKTAALTSCASFFASPLMAKTQDKNAILGFKAIDINTKDTFVVPEGYEAKPLISWADPLFSKAREYDESKNIDEKAIENANFVMGDNNDGMFMFELENNRALIAVNNEYINPEIMFNHKGKNINLNDVKYMQNSCGVSIFEVKRLENGFYELVKDSKYNRRITAQTPISISGPAKGDEKLKTKADKKGKLVYGTINNCASGKTPWGTYLTCEENFNDFFDASAEFSQDASQKRYGIKKGAGEYGWSLDERFDVSKNPNEPNRFGWVVEIDPYDPNSMPIKRTALGRFKHENAEVVLDKSSHVVVYMGDDEKHEFIYKFVSKNKYDGKARNLLDEGTLYVAKFNGKVGDNKGSGEWIELVHGKNGLDSKNGFNSQADVAINARLAASIVGATPMDRPEWVAADPNSDFVYVTLTNNDKREELNAPNPRKNNIYGHILRFVNDGSHINTKFSWDIFLLAGNEPFSETGASKNINKDNIFNSPDGLKFDKYSRLWIQTDGKYSNKGAYANMGNNQMFCADPLSGELRRFLSGPIACEITGVIISDDCKTMLVGVQHPGEKGANSTFPYGKTPRSTIMQIRKFDGGILGS